MGRSHIWPMWKITDHWQHYLMCKICTSCNILVELEFLILHYSLNTIFFQANLGKAKKKIIHPQCGYTSKERLNTQDMLVLLLFLCGVYLFTLTWVCFDFKICRNDKGWGSNKHWTWTAGHHHLTKLKKASGHFVRLILTKIFTD